VLPQGAWNHWSGLAVSAGVEGGQRDASVRWIDGWTASPRSTCSNKCRSCDGSSTAGSTSSPESGRGRRRWLTARAQRDASPDDLLEPEAGAAPVLVVCAMDCASGFDALSESLGVGGQVTGTGGGQPRGGIARRVRLRGGDSNPSRGGRAGQQPCCLVEVSRSAGDHSCVSRWSANLPSRHHFLRTAAMFR